LDGADKLWKSLQQGIENYVNTHGGSASINDPETVRPDWDQLQNVLNGDAPVESLEGCN
jgi:hypothetical protein